MRKLIFIFSLLLTFSNSAFAAEKIKIVVTTSVIADLVKQVTGEWAEIYTIAAPNRDIHFYHPTPKDVLKVKKADVFVHGGLDLEAWRNPLLEAAGNRRFLGNAEASIDVSKNIKLLDVPDSVSRVEGDIHIYGNPHYWLDPDNAKMMIGNIVGSLNKLYPGDSELFSRNGAQYKNNIEKKIPDWAMSWRPYRGTVSAVTYHNSWAYFAKRFGVEVVGQLEPKPGIPPTAKHLAQLIALMKEKNVGLIIKESFQESRTPEKLSKASGAQVVTLLQFVGERDEAKDYISMMDYNFNELKKALENKGSDD